MTAPARISPHLTSGLLFYVCAVVVAGFGVSEFVGGDAPFGVALLLLAVHQVMIGRYQNLVRDMWRLIDVRGGSAS